MSDDGRYFVMPMPFNASGSGPETNPDKIVGISWEVWNELNIAVDSFEDRPSAQADADRRNARECAK